MAANRREVIQGAVGAALAAASGQAQAAAGKAPNVVFILADDMGVADLSCYGRNSPGTPAIDSLARDGAKFGFAYANSCVCSATRTGLITGRYQYRLRVGLEEPLASADPAVGLPSDHPTLPSMLRKLGYETALVGKWHMGAPPEHGPRQCGYDRFFGLYGGATDYFKHKLGVPGIEHIDGLFEQDTPVEKIGYMTDLLGDKAVAEIDRFAGRDAPFLLSLHFTAPHWPWEGPEDEAVSRAIQNPRHPDGGNVEVYGRMLKSMDDNVAKVLAALERHGLAQNTIVVFSSDNGGERFSDTWPLVGRKGELLEGGIRVPLLVRWPARVKAGLASDQVTISMDWVPTLLEAAGGSPDKRYPSDGVSLLPVLTGGATQARTLFWRYKANEQAVVRSGDWKYLRLGGKEHLFDVRQDQREQADLKERHPETFQALKAKFAAWNATMLPYPEGSFSEDARHLYPDRY